MPSDLEIFTTPNFCLLIQRNEYRSLFAECGYLTYPYSLLPVSYRATQLKSTLPSIPCISSCGHVTESQVMGLKCAVARVLPAREDICPPYSLPASKVELGSGPVPMTLKQQGVEEQRDERVLDPCMTWWIRTASIPPQNCLEQLRKEK
jgi:hypothetical protein